MTEQAKVLVVDDNPGLLETFSLILKRLGYDVDTAEDGLCALEKFKRFPFDVTLMDIVMPNMNGVEAFREIRHIDPEAKVILMTAYYDDDQIRMALDEGAYTTLNKPIDVAQLLDLIKEATGIKSVLIVDDDSDFCRTLASMLEAKGYRVNTAFSGEEAINICKEKEFQIAFIDVKMPFMDGLETYMHLKEINPDIVGVMMTAYRDEVLDRVEKALAAKASTCLYKPFEPLEAVHLVNQISSI